MPNFLKILFFITITVSATAQPIVYVTPAGAGNASGTSWTNALSGTLLAGRVATAAPGTQFWVAAGTYKPTTTTDRTASFSIASGVSVYGGFSGNERSLAERKITSPLTTIFSGNLGYPGMLINSFHVVRFLNASPTTRLDGVAIVSGNASGDPLTNLPDRSVGGGIYNDGSNGSSSSPVLVNCTISGNSAYSDGGGVYNNGNTGICTPVFIKCRIESNIATNGLGGGMYNDGTSGRCAPRLINCTVTSNLAMQGSAIHNEAYLGDCSPVITNCIFKGNLHGQFYGGVVFNRGIGGNCQPVISNTIFWENPYSLPSIHNESATPQVTYCDIQDGYLGIGNISQDPQFFNFYTNDFRLLKSSPVIDAGTPTIALTFPQSIDTTDAEGKPRVLNGRIDMGPIEYIPNSVTGIVYATPLGNGNGVSGSSWDNAINGYTLRPALSEAAPGTQFWLASGSYFPTFTVNDRTTSFKVPSGVEIHGGFVGSETRLENRRITYPSSTTLSGNIGTSSINDNSFHIVLLENTSSATLLDNLVISGANASDEPFIQGNGTLAKGAVINNNSKARFTNCLITKNTTYNPLGRGGGVANFGSSPTFTNCIFSENFSYLGGGMYNGENSSPTIINSLFTSNSAVQGGIGSAMYNDTDTKVTLTNCTIARNVDSNTYSGPIGGGVTSARDCIICESLIGLSANGPVNALPEKCRFSSGAYTEEISINGLFNDAANGNFQLRATSPAINAGDPSTVGLPTFDLAGQVRIQNGRVDMGAYEFVCVPVTCQPYFVQRIR